MISDEQSKAVQEISKTTGKFADITEKVGCFVSKVIGGASNQVGGVLEDWTRYYRYKNLLLIADKVEALHAKRKLLGKTIAIPPRLAIPILEAASLEDDETLQMVWARLIANGTDIKYQEFLHPVFIEIAKQLSSDEALILAKCSMHNELRYQIIVNTKSNSVEINYHKLNEENELRNYEKVSSGGTIALKNINSYDVYIDNLTRLQIFDDQQMWANSTYGLTTFGKTFISSCISDVDYVSN